MCVFFICVANNFNNDFGEFMSRDPFFNSSQNQSNNSNINNSANSFPIGTFSIEQTTNSSQQSQQQSSNFNQSDFFGSSNGMSNGGGTMNGTIGTFNANTNSTGSHANNNNGNADPGQATRETGIIEKLLVCLSIMT